MTIDSARKQTLVVLRGALRAKEFTARGTTFYRRNEDGNTSIISLQSSVKSTRTEREVTLNYGAYSQRIGTALQDDAAWALDVARAHWRKRLSEGGRERWLRVSNTQPAEERAHLILDGVNRLMPDLVAHSTDAALRDEWLAGASPGLGAMQRLLYLAILLNKIGPSEKLADVLSDLRGLVAGQVHSGLVEGQLARAGVRVED
jgi:hypothetical protein